MFHFQYRYATGSHRCYVILFYNVSMHSTVSNAMWTPENPSIPTQETSVQSYVQTQLDSQLRTIKARCCIHTFHSILRIRHRRTQIVKSHSSGGSQ